MGWWEARRRLTQVRRGSGQEGMGPREVEAQLKSRTRSAISPAPKMRREGAVDGLAGDAEVGELVCTDVLGSRMRAAKKR
jgi:hypothetical protein